MMSSTAGFAFAVAFVSVIAVCVIAEQVMPAFVRPSVDHSRVSTNVVLGCMAFAIDAGLPIAVAVVATAATQGFGGILPALGASSALRFVGTLVAMSLAQYAFHRAAHAFEPLWRMHRVHHTDCALDVTTAFRHHPFEVVLTTIWYSAVGTVIGASPVAIAAYGTAALLLSIAQHANVTLGARAETILSWALVTPGLHHIHHSARVQETDSNFGDVVPWWDQLFGTIAVRSQEQRRSMRIGLGGDYDAGSHSIRAQLALPFATESRAPKPSLTPRA